MSDQINQTGQYKDKRVNSGNEALSTSEIRDANGDIIVGVCTGEEWDKISEQPYKRKPKKK